jgi:two-component system chemotaxis sensor kinase CheA
MNVEFDEVMDEFVLESLDHLGKVESLLLSLEASGQEDSEIAINRIFRAVHSIKGSAGFVGLSKINHLAHATESVLDQVRSKRLTVAASVIDVLLLAIDHLRGMVGQARQSNEMEIKDLVRAFEEITSKSEPSVISNAVIAPHEAEPQLKPTAIVPALTKSSETVIGTAKKSHGKSSIRVPVTTLNRLISLAGKLNCCRDRLIHAVRSKQSDRLESMTAELDRVACDLQGTIMQTSVQPIGSVFSRVSRMVRDLGSKLGKQCELVIDGRDVEIDKSIAEAIADPIVHMVRNSLDHGLEKSQERITKGKPPTGKITLAAFNRGDRVCIEIQDDGAGISVTTIKAKAVSKGHITQVQANRMSDREALRLIFTPGFSTATGVSEVSRRVSGWTSCEPISSSWAASSILKTGKEREPPFE